MPALLANIRLNSREKLLFFKRNFGAILSLFDEFHLKIRGDFSSEGAIFCKETIGDKLRLYQYLPDGNWVYATREMLKRVSNRSVFLFWEDFSPTASLEEISNCLQVFDRCELDFLPYIGFNTPGMPNWENLLPLNPRHTDSIVYSEISGNNIHLLLKIMPKAYVFTLPSVVSKRFLHEVLLERQVEDSPVKIFSPFLNWLILRVFGFPNNHLIYRRLNEFVRFLKTEVLMHPLSSPHSLERLAVEHLPERTVMIRYGVPRIEIFANWDDDYGFYGTSLLQRGLYPYSTIVRSQELPTYEAPVCFPKTLFGCERFPLFYLPRAGRPSRPSILKIRVLGGTALVETGSEQVFVNFPGSILLYANKISFISSSDHSELKIEISIYADELI